MTSCVCRPPPTEEEVRNKIIDKNLKDWKKLEDSVVKLLLLGTGESGKSTITKQMRIIHINGYSHSDRLERVEPIRKNIKDSILSICGAMSLLNIPLDDLRLQDSIDYLMTEAIREDFDYPQIFYDHTEKLWADSGVQHCYRLNSLYQLIDSAKYFLDKVTVVRQDDYVPTDQDILRCRIMTNDINWIDFTVRDRRVDVKFRVFDVGGQQGERRKWIQVFDCTTAILFVLDISSYDLTLRERQDKNRLLEAIETFRLVWNNKYLRSVSIILFFNKIDLLEEKINAGKSFQTFVDSLKKKKVPTATLR